MKIISDLNDHLKTMDKPYVFSIPIFISHLEDGTAHVQIQLRVTDIKDKSYYDIVVIRTVFENDIVELTQVYNQFEYWLNREILFSAPTSKLTDLNGNVVKTFRDIIKIVLNDEIMPTK